MLFVKLSTTSEAIITLWVVDTELVNLTTCFSSDILTIESLDLGVPSLRCRHIPPPHISRSHGRNQISPSAIPRNTIISGASDDRVSTYFLITEATEPDHYLDASTSISLKRPPDSFVCNFDTDTSLREISDPPKTPKLSSQILSILEHELNKC